MNEYEFLGRLIMKVVETLGYGIMAIIVALLIQLIVFRTTKFSIYNYLKRNLS
jgi:hypothetical protein